MSSAPGRTDVRADPRITSSCIAGLLFSIVSRALVDYYQGMDTEVHHPVDDAFRRTTWGNTTAGANEVCRAGRRMMPFYRDRGSSRYHHYVHGFQGDAAVLDFIIGLSHDLHMRLTEFQQKEIARTTAEVFGESASVSLFGSRADDSARGGDIDLFITTDLDAETARRRKLRFLTVLKRRIGDRRIDVVLHSPETVEREIHRIASTEGVPIL